MSWFWPQVNQNQAPLNYTGRVKTKNIMQRRMSQKQHDSRNYCACIYSYVQVTELNKILLR